jgi:hypothetical protein
MMVSIWLGWSMEQIPRGRSDPRDLTNKDEAVRFAGRQLGGHYAVYHKHKKIWPAPITGTRRGADNHWGIAKDAPASHHFFASLSLPLLRPQVQFQILMVNKLSEWTHLILSYRRILVTEGIRRQRFELAI